MTRKRFNVVTIATMIAILALGSLGLGYAAWSTNLNIGVTADGGTANVDYVIETTREYSSQNSSAWGSPQTIGYAGCDAAIVDANNLSLNVTDMFPGYRCEVVVNIKNTGTVPVTMSGFQFTGGPAGTGAGDADLGTDDSCTAEILPTHTVQCTASLWLDYADTDFNDKTLSANLAVTFSQSQP